MAKNMSDLRVLICEDEYMLAIDMAQQLKQKGIGVTAVVSRLSEAQAVVNAAEFDANAAILDLRLYNDWVYPVVPALAARGAAVVICSGYAQSDLPADVAHLPFFSKPVMVEHVVEVLRATAK